MYGNYKANHRNTGHRRIVSIVVALTMLCSLLPAHVFATGLNSTDEYLCGHTHSEACINSEGGEDISCGHNCNILYFNNNTAGSAIDTYQAKAGQAYDSICSALPESLCGKTECTQDDVDIPVLWSCEDFTDEAGTYIFRAQLANENCTYTAADDEQTEEVDESALPFISVTVPQAKSAKNTSGVYSISDPTNSVTVSGTDCALDGARLVVKTVALSEAQMLLGDSEATALFAYDIKIMTGGELDGETGEYVGEVEYQPADDNPVKVTITTPEPVESPVEVVHIAQDEETGEIIPQTVENVVTTDEGALEFSAEGFSVYIIGIRDTSKVSHSVRFTAGDYTVKHCTTQTGVYENLTSYSVSIGTATAGVDTLYIKIEPNVGFTLGEVTASSGLLTLIDASEHIYSLDVLGATATIYVTITVTGVKITGVPTRGGNLTVTPSDDIITQAFEYSWYSCESADGTFDPIVGQNNATLQLTGTTYNDKYIKVLATDGTNDYYSAAVGPVATDGMIFFDLANGSVEIGYEDNGNASYRGYNIAGALVSGVHSDTNRYMVMQSNSDTVTSNRIILTGDVPKPKYDITLSDINCNTSDNRSKGGIIANAVSTQPMEIIIRLEGDNYVGRLHYATGASGEESISSLKITSALGDGYTAGSLTANSKVEWSAAIGGIDDAAYESSRNITIAGGTVTANAAGNGYTGSSAIGGGGNGTSDVTITGGVVVATNCGTGATIGGGGGRSLDGGVGYVTISGGTVTATNAYANGVAIGSGGSLDAIGSDTIVNISGGTVTTSGNIGGGCSTDNVGGNAIIDISGGNVKVTNGSIGGGDSVTRTGGNVTISITGGTVSTPHISGGYSGETGTYNDASVLIAAASVYIGDRANINSVLGPDPVSGMEVVVYSQEIDVSELSGFTGDSEGLLIESTELTDGLDYYLADVYSDENGKLYFWLPTGIDIVSLTIDGQTYLVEGAQVQTATITHDSSTVGTRLGAVLNYGTPESYKWQKSSNGTDNWTDISGATSQYYTVVQDDLHYYIRVIITASNELSITSGSLLITPTPHARINYSVLYISCVLEAQLLNATATSYQWQQYDTDTATWGSIANATEAEYTVIDSDAGKRIRVVISDGTIAYTSTYVVINSPSFIVTIPESVTATTATGSFPVSMNRNYFAQTHTLTVSCSGSFELKLNESPSTILNYTLYSDSALQREISNNGTVATFSGNGNNTVPVYYSIGNPIYSGNYTDTLTFTVSFDNGL